MRMGSKRSTSSSSITFSRRMGRPRASVAVPEALAVARLAPGSGKFRLVGRAGSSRSRAAAWSGNRDGTSTVSNRGARAPSGASSASRSSTTSMPEASEPCTPPITSARASSRPATNHASTSRPSSVTPSTPRMGRVSVRHPRWMRRRRCCSSSEGHSGSGPWITSVSASQRSSGRSRSQRCSRARSASSGPGIGRARRASITRPSSRVEDQISCRARASGEVRDAHAASHTSVMGP